MHVRMTLTGSYAGHTKLLNGIAFCDGIAEFEGTEEEVENISKYFSRSYQAKCECEPTGNVAVMEDPEEEVPEPDVRQQRIMEAINGIDKEEWANSGAVPHPKVKDIATLMDDATVTLAEILFVIETWPL